jgi:3-oxoacyl-[acyl-carrier protein] reductase
VLDASLTGAFFCTRKALPHKRSRKYGRIVSFSSMSWRGNFRQANYVAAKAGIVGLTRTIALETARQGITANAIAPGLIETPMRASMNTAAREKLIAKCLNERPGSPATSPTRPPTCAHQPPDTSAEWYSTSTAD